MKLTKAQFAGLQNISTWSERYGRAYHKEQANKTLLAVRQNVLEVLEMRGLIASQKPFSSPYYGVTLTPAGRAALQEGKE